ncbi:Transcriptional regulator, AbiEi antitoxin, Type IV TA system [Propionicimonas paludicola]|uniref:Transcriptional regulator, AbiEi antitoxin, Type IV TA system n=1 Tax=Propionicimonas paludicola TaxID=185243 RepID=A0A2A9CR22_9ACTN|nr:Transcriptional regulator, AbiEi antitoxin, Type IV TA system [Propionicimonas paludicola]
MARAAQLAVEGADRMSLTRQVRAGSLVRVRHGAYASELGVDAMERHLQLVAATWPLLGESAVLSHSSAAVLHGLPTWERDLAKVTVIRPEGGHGRAGTWLHARLGALEPDQVCQLQNLRVTSLARTAVDRACGLSYDRAVATLDAALRAGVRRSELEQIVRGARRRHGVGVARAALAFADGASESVGESISRVLIAQVGLPAPSLQVEIRDRSGRWVARSDFGWLEQRVVGEFDGRIKYLGDEASVADTVIREKAREQAIRDAGWVVVRWTWADLSDPIGFRRRVQAAFDHARGLTNPAS